MITQIRLIKRLVGKVRVSVMGSLFKTTLKQSTRIQVNKVLSNSFHRILQICQSSIKTVMIIFKWIHSIQNPFPATLPRRKTFRLNQRIIKLSISNNLNQILSPESAIVKIKKCCRRQILKTKIYQRQAYQHRDFPSKNNRNQILNLLNLEVTQATSDLK